MQIKQIATQMANKIFLWNEWSCGGADPAGALPEGCELYCAPTKSKHTGPVLSFQGTGAKVESEGP